MLWNAIHVPTGGIGATKIKYIAHEIIYVKHLAYYLAHLNGKIEQGKLLNLYLYYKNRLE